MSDNDDILAAELALRLLEPAEDTVARAQAAGDAALARRVAWWQGHFAALVDDGSQTPSAGLWERIVAALPQNDNSAGLIQIGARRWRAAAIAAMLVAAVLAGTLALRQPPQPNVAAPELVAALEGDGAVKATIGYDTASGRLSITPAAVETGPRDAELWIIPADGTPRSLGVIDSARPTHPTVPSAKRGLIAAGTIFAITLEPKGGSPSGLPTGPRLAAGKIIEI